MQTKFMVRTHLLLTVRRSNEMNLLKKKNSKPECDCRSLVNNTVYLLEKDFLEVLMQNIETHWSTSSSSSELNFSCYFLLPHQQKAAAHKVLERFLI